MALPKVLVRVSDRIAAYGGVLHDYTQGVNIGPDPVDVEPTSLVMRWISRGELEVVDRPPQETQSTDDELIGGKWPIKLRLDVVDIFEKMGYTPSDVRSMTDEELLSIRGIGNKTLKHIREVMG